MSDLTGEVTVETRFRKIQCGDVDVFYREAGSRNNPTILLLHGFPTSSHMFRNLIPLLSKRFHVVAPDLPGFGLTSVQRQSGFVYSFDALAHIIAQFTDALTLNHYGLYLFDYGAPVGLRLAIKRPDCVSAIISQNGNAYEVGLSEAWTPLKRYWSEPTMENREALRGLLSLETTKWQYLHGVTNEEFIAPEAYWLDFAYLQQSNRAEIQLDLFLDYRSNIDLYPAFQHYLRTRQPPILAVWGKNDPFFLPQGAEAYRRDVPSAHIHFFDTGHFALETHVQDIARLIHVFYERLSFAPKH